MKYLTYDQLKRYNTASIKAKRNRNFIWKELKENINEEHLFPVISSMIHNDREIRIRIGLGIDGMSGYLDITPKQFNELSDITHDDNGESFPDTKIETLS